MEVMLLVIGLLITYVLVQVVSSWESFTDLYARLGGHKPKIAEQNKFWTEVFNTTIESATQMEINQKYRYLEKFVLDQPHFRSIELEALKTLRDTALSSIELRDFMRGKDGSGAGYSSQGKQYQDRQREQASQAQTGSYAVNWRHVLGVAANERDWRTIQKAYRQKVKLVHPDRGGNPKLATRLGEAFDLAKRELRPAH